MPHDLPARRGPGRPPATTRAAVEQSALALMLEHGYDAVSIPQIAEAAGIGRTTYFRYFASKAGVIWGPFDDTIDGLRTALAEESETSDPLAAVRRAVVASSAESLHDSDVWLERFWLLDRNPSLQAGALEHWDRWRGVIADFLGTHLGLSPDSLVPMTISTTAQAAYLSNLRTVPQDGGDREALLARLDDDLGRVLAALSVLLPE